MESVSTRTSPLLDLPGKDEVLPYAPAPWILKRCSSTGFVFLANPPDYAALEETFAYESTFAQESQARRAAEPFRYSVSTLIKRFRQRVLKRNGTLSRLRKMLGQSSSKSINVLDVGCGWGSLMEELLSSLPPDVRSRCVPHGIEISRELARLSNEKFNAIGGYCLQAPALDGMDSFPAGHFDFVVMGSYLEHEVNPVEVLRKCLGRMKPEGAVLVKVPNFDSLNRHLRGPRWCGFRWPDHVNHFTPDTLRATAERAGFRMQNMRWADANALSDSMYAVLVPA